MKPGNLNASTELAGEMSLTDMLKLRKELDPDAPDMIVMPSNAAPAPSVAQPACECCDHPSGFLPAVPDNGKWLHQGRDSVEVCTAPVRKCGHCGKDKTSPECWNCGECDQVAQPEADAMPEDDLATLEWQVFEYLKDYNPDTDAVLCPVCGGAVDDHRANCFLPQIPLLIKIARQANGASTATPATAAVEAAKEIVERVYQASPREFGEIANLVAAILSRYFPMAEQRHYHCSCGAVCTAEEYIEHVFEKGHDRGLPARQPETLRPDLDWALRELADGWISNNEREGEYGFNRNARRVLELLLADSTQEQEIARLKGEVEHWVNHYNELEQWRAQTARINTALHVEIERMTRWQTDVENREAACCPEDVGFDEYIRSLEQKLATARADAIGEAVIAVRAVADGPASRAGSRAQIYHHSEGIRAALCALEALIQPGVGGSDDVDEGESKGK
jgi:hypothetical protein